MEHPNSLNFKTQQDFLDYTESWRKYTKCRDKIYLHALNYTWPANMGQTIRKSNTFNTQQPMSKHTNTPGTIVHKQLIKAWAKVSKQYIKEAKFPLNVTMEAFNEGYDKAAKEDDVTIKRLQEQLKAAVAKANNAEAAVKLVIAMGLSQDAMAHAIRYILNDQTKGY